MKFLKILFVVFVFIIVKTSIEKMIGAIFSIEKVIDHHIYEKLSYRNFLSLLLIVTNLIFYFSVKPDLNILLILTGILFLVNMVILFYGYKKYRSLIFSNLFYFLLYICALEISPYIILYKAFI